MALKRKITKAEHAALNPLIQAEYRADGEDFVLDATGFDDPAELRRARDREKEDATNLRSELVNVKDKLAAATSKLETITSTDARRAGDVQTLEKSWKEKLDTETGALKTTIAAKDKYIQKVLVDNVAMSLATELAGDNHVVLLPHITQRLSAEMTGDTPLTRVLDKEGKPTALSVEDLKKEFSTDTRFASVVVGSKGSGGGAAGRSSRSGAPGAGGGQKKFHELSDKERIDWYKSDPAGFKEASEASRAELQTARGVAS
jgi:hypothetical protein